MNDPEFKALLEVLEESTPSERVEFLKWRDKDSQEIRANKLLLWWFYYFHHNFITPLAPFHYDWLYYYAGDLNILKKGFRGSLKTEITKVYVVNSICFVRFNFIVWQSFESNSSEEDVRNIARMLRNSRLMEDYGELFPLSSPKEDLAKKSIGNFNTTNGVKVVAKSLGEKLRGAVSYDDVTGSSRPDLLILNDIDVSDSVRNIDIINKNYEKITGETIGAMSKERSRILFDGNVINTDGVVPRFEKEKANSSNWKIFSQGLYNEDGSISWDFFDNDRIEKIRSNEGERAFNQNYLLIPINLYEGGLIKEHEVRYYEYLSLHDFDELYMHSDTTHTGKQTSDYFASGVLGLNKRDKNFYLIDFFLDKVDVEIQARTAIVLYQKYSSKIKKMTYDEKSNNGFGFWIKKLAKEEYGISLPIEDLKYPNDKVTHFEPHIPHFKANRVYLPSKHPMIKIAVDQVTAFPNKGVNDDFVDLLSGLLDNYAKKDTQPQAYFFN